MGEGEREDEEAGCASIPGHALESLPTSAQGLLELKKRGKKFESTFQIFKATFS